MLKKGQIYEREPLHLLVCSRFPFQPLDTVSSNIVSVFSFKRSIEDAAVHLRLYADVLQKVVLDSLLELTSSRCGKVLSAQMF